MNKVRQSDLGTPAITTIETVQVEIDGMLEIEQIHDNLRKIIRS